MRMCCAPTKFACRPGKCPDLDVGDFEIGKTIIEHTVVVVVWVNIKLNDRKIQWDKVEKQKLQ